MCAQGTTHGLAILVLDALCGTGQDGKTVEWINEDTLAEHMNLHVQQARKALRFLEQVCLHMQNIGFGSGLSKGLKAMPNNADIHALPSHSKLKG